MNLPNKLTIFRIILVPIMVIISFLNIDYSICGFALKWIIIDLIFIIASITDKLDGHIARKNNQITTLGKFLDPIADKILVLSVMIMLVEDGRLYAWVAIIILFREFIVSGYRLIAVEKGGKVISASIWGKLKTVTQMIAIIILLIDKNGFLGMINNNLSLWELILNIASSLFMTIAIIATIFSGYEYIKDGKQYFKS